MKLRLTPIDIASLSLGLTIASGAVIVSDMMAAWSGWLQPLVVVLVTVMYGFAMRVAYERAYNHISRSWLVALTVLMNVIATAVALALFGTVAEALDGHGDLAIHVIEYLVIGALFGLFIGVPLVPFALVLGTAAKRELVDVLDRVLVGGASLVAISALLASALQMHRDTSYGGLMILAIATAMFMIAALKIRTRARWLHAVLRGEVPGWAVIDRFDGDDQLPAIGVRLRNSAVLATGNFTGGPFRAGGGVSPVARVDRDGGYMLLAYIAFALAALTLVANPLSLWRRAVKRDHEVFGATSDPIRFKNLGPMDDVSVGRYAACAHLTDGTSKCWGSSAGTFIDGVMGAERTPTIARDLHGSKVFLGGRQYCVLDSGVAHCAAPGTRVARDQPNVTAVGFNAGWRYLLHADGTVTKVGPMMMTEYETTIVDVPPAQAIAMSNVVACILTRDGEVSCDRHLNDDDQWALTKVEGFGDNKVDRIAVGFKTAYARVTTLDGHRSWYAWEGHEAAPVDHWRDVEELAPTLLDVCARRKDGSVFCDTNSSVLDEKLKEQGTREVLPAGSAVQLTANDDVICARGKADVWCWGDL